jgi:penicillin-binding protein 1A
MNKWPQKAIQFIIVSLVTLLLIPIVAVGILVVLYQTIPMNTALPPEKPQPDAGASYVYASDGSLIGVFKEADTRIIVPSDQISKNMKIAAVASEDHNFYHHSGVDWTGVFRAFLDDILHGGINQGGSSITQQLAKNLYTDGQRTVLRKAEETMIAKKLEKKYSKDEILTKYLNTVYIGNQSYGVEAASQSYFHKSAKDLTLSEAALLAGVLPAPSDYSPISHPQIAETRRNEILDKILKYHLASKAEVEAAHTEKPVIFSSMADVTGHTVATTPIVAVSGPVNVSATTDTSKYPYFMDYVRNYLVNIKHYDPELLYQGGLRIDTTLDPHLEDVAQETLKNTLPNPKDPEAALVSVEPTTGYVKALVGGTDWNESKVNMALGKLGGGSGRQAGSSFKPFVLARAYEAGMPPSKIYSAPSSIQPPGFKKPVGNFEGESFGVADLNKAIANSINTVFVQVIGDVGVRQTGELASRLGITSIDLSKPVYPSIAIGSQEVSPLDMASAYGVFANQGTRFTPTPILKMTLGDGSIVEDNTHPQGQLVLDPNVANNVTQSLTGVVLHGTGVAANIGRPVAGKTGTSEQHQNAWFVGYTPQLSTAIWMGYKDANISLYGIYGVGAVTGGTWPARMWHTYMTEAMKNVPVQGFPVPAPIQPGR